MSYWICANERPNESYFYEFTKKFEIDRPTKFTAKTSGDTRYQLYINGQLAAEGPCEGSSFQRYYEEGDYTKFLMPGENTVRAKVFYASDNAAKAFFRGSRPAFWLDGDLTSGIETVKFGTDSTWRCRRDDTTKFKEMKAIHLTVPPCEVTARYKEMTDVETVEWFSPNLSNGGYSPFGRTDPYRMVKRPIPAMKTWPERKMKLVRQGEGFVEFDAGVYTTAKVHMVLTGKSGAKVRVCYAECYSSKNETAFGSKNMRDFPENEDSTLAAIKYDTLTLDNESIEHEPFWYHAFRFIRFEFEPSAEVRVRELTYAPYFYPLEIEGSFECSDERLNQIWNTSINTVMCCMHEMYVDCPYYEQAQYDMDSCLEAIFTMHLSRDHRMPLKSLTDLADSQQPSGFMLANYPETGAQIIPNFTLYWVFMLREFLRYDGDVSAIVKFAGTLDKVLAVFENYMTEDGLIGPIAGWPFVDWVPGWERGVPTGGCTEPLTVTSLLYAAALKAGAEVCDAMGKTKRADEYYGRANKIIARVNKVCFDKKVGLYKNTPMRDEYSQHTMIWAVLSGAVMGREAGKLVDRTFNSDVSVAESTFSMNYFMFCALEAADRLCYVPKVFEGWQKMLDQHCTTWCENPDNPRSECHGWSSAPIYVLSDIVLGVVLDSNGADKVIIKPNIGVFGLTYAKGAFPTPHGLVKVDWQVIDSVFDLKVELPDGVSAQVILPNGQVKKLPMGDGQFVCKLD